MAELSDSKIRKIVSQFFGEEKAVQRFDPTDQAARDALAPEPDVGTPDLAALRRKFLGAAGSEQAPPVDYDVGTGADEYKDEIVAIRTDDDTPSAQKSIVVDGEGEDIIGLQG